MDQLINPQNLVLSAEQFTLLLPYFVLLFGGMITLLLGVMKSQSRNMAAFLSCLVTLGLSIGAVTQVWGEPSVKLFNDMMVVDYFSSLFNVVLLGATFLVMVGSKSYLEKQGIHHTEFYALSIFSCLGMMLLTASLDLIVLFISLEVMSIAVYVLVGFRRTDVKSNEAALKYFVLGSAASAIMLFGMSFVYGSTGTMNILELAALFKNTELAQTLTTNPILILGSIFLLVGFLFKVAAVPFHMWMPDVYEGAPTQVTNLMTTGLKAAAFASFLRVFMSFGFTDHLDTAFGTGFHNVLWVIAILTMFFGNIIALTQTNIKRMLAYSSIAHTGYIIIGFISGARSEYGYSSIIVYLISYVIMNLGAFTIVSLLSERQDKNTDLIDFAGLGFKKPLLGFAMAVFMFSMAGVPPTVGFAGKYLLFSSAVESGEVVLAILAVLCSAISAYYYLRVIVYMYMREPVTEHRSSFAVPVQVIIVVATLATLQFGIFPSILIHAAKKAASL